MILVAGATGVVGGMIVARLADQGKRVRALVRSGNSAESLSAGGVEMAIGDLKDRASLDRACEGVVNLLETYDSVIQMDSLAQEFGVVQVSVDQSIRGRLKAAATA
jgi:uncharacterized protein YbjT (DUF2867 family)